MVTTDAEEQYSHMYNNVRVQGKKLSEWAKELHFQYSLGELYQMAKGGQKLSSLAAGC